MGAILEEYLVCFCLLTLPLLSDGCPGGKIESALTQENKTQTATSIAVLQTKYYCIALCAAVCGVGTFQGLHNILDLHKHSVIFCKHPESAAVQCSAVQCSAVQCSAVQCSAV